MISLSKSIERRVDVESPNSAPRCRPIRAIMFPTEFVAQLTSFNSSSITLSDIVNSLPADAMAP